MTRDELSTIIGEVLKDWWYLDSTMGETQERLTAKLEYHLAPVQSGGVVTREAIEEAYEAWRERKRAEAFSFAKWHIKELLDAIYALQLPAPTPQPEAREVDLSVIEASLKFIADRHDTPVVQKTEAQKAIAHLQQAPQGVIEHNSNGLDFACLSCGINHDPSHPAPVKVDDQ